MKKTIQILAAICMMSLASVSHAQSANVGVINISVQCLMGPSFDQLLQGYKSILTQSKLKVIDVQATGQNGYGKPCAGYIKYQMPTTTGQVKHMASTLNNCMFGDIFSQSQTNLNMINMMNGTVVSFTPTSFNGYGKPCSADIAYTN